MNWKELLKQESERDYYKALSASLLEESKKYNIFPVHDNLFNALKACPLDKVKVVILGQDPYHGAGQAHGLSFSVPQDCPIPPSLKNIFKEIQSDLQVSNNFAHGCLVNWATQGVLLLNTVLTVRENQAGSHRNLGWEHLTDSIIRAIDGLDRSVVFLLWGGFAKTKKSLITNPNHLILEAAHPSPLSAHNGFFGCKHFSKANKFLVDNNVEPIDWLNI